MPERVMNAIRDGHPGQQGVAGTLSYLVVKALAGGVAGVQVAYFVTDNAVECTTVIAAFTFWLCRFVRQRFGGNNGS